MSGDTGRRLITFAIGLGTITAGVFAWRAGQIGSTANFDDRQSISQQVDLETIRIDTTVEASRQARQYDRYVIDYAEAESLDEEAAELRDAGSTELAAVAESEAEALRTEATRRAFASGVFSATGLANAAEVTPEPRPFDLGQRIQELNTAATTGLASKGSLDPQAWADSSDAIRARIRTLIQWVAVLLTAVVLLTAAEVTVSSRVRAVVLPLGLVLFAVGLVGGLTNGFWA